MQKCCEAGVDILEVGFPAKDPSFDGEVIRAAQEQVDKVLAADVGYWRELRKRSGCSHLADGLSR